VIEVVANLLDSDVIGRQPDVRVGVAIVLLDVRLEVVGVGDRPETRCQRREGGDGHVITVVSDLGSAFIFSQGPQPGILLMILVRDRTLRVAVARLVMGTLPVLDVVAIALFTLHDVMDGARGGVLTIIVHTTSELPLLELVMALVNVAASVAAVPVLVEVSAQVATLRGVRAGLVDFFLDGGELVMCRSIRSTTRMSAQCRCRRVGRRAPLFHQGCGDLAVSVGIC
jgi:hypothetical protein